jgi:glucose-6-phosphate 1-dehydrogenase
MHDVYFGKPPSPEGAVRMSFQICIKTEKSLQQLATEMRDLFSLPPFKQSSFSGESYCQFEMLGLLILIHPAEEDRDLEVMDYPYCFDMQVSFADHELDTDDMEYRLQPYYAELLSFQLGIDTAYHEKQKVDHAWKIRYHFCSKNPKWNRSILYGEPGWQPAVLRSTPSPWRSMRPMF